MTAPDCSAVPAGQLQPGEVVRFGSTLAVVTGLLEESAGLVRVTLAIHRLATEPVEVVR